MSPTPEPPPALSRSTVDRSATLRTEEAMAPLWADPGTRVLLLDDDARAAVQETDAGPELLLVGPADAPDGERFFLGAQDGTAYFAVPHAPLPRRLGTRAAGLRDLGALLGDRDAGLLTHAVALAHWHSTHTHCPRCGAPTLLVKGGASRRCTADDSDHFPRVDPAVIMLVYDDAGRAVLGRQPVWPPRRYSVLAGFVEPGESAEQAVVRETREECGLPVTDVRYAGSQPWPFPSSLMLAFTARATSDALGGDADEELEEVRWVTREQVRDGMATGTLLLPPSVSIARRLLDSWLAEDDGAAVPEVPWD